MHHGVSLMWIGGQIPIIRQDCDRQTQCKGDRMSRIQATTGGCLAMFIVSMVVAATAQALPEWQKEGKALTEALSFKSHGSTGQFEDGAVHISWTSVSGKGTFKGTNEISGLSLTFGASWVTG